MVMVTFLGESIHGVSEFTRFKLDWIRDADAPVVIFEADHIGLRRAYENEESPIEAMENFPRIHRTREMLELLEYVVEQGIPYYGADVIPRNQHGNFEGVLGEARERQLDAHRKIFASADFAPPRDEYMAEVVAECIRAHADRPVVGLFHNAHIKKHGSLEVGELKLPSVAEVLRDRHGYESRGIGLFAKTGSTLHNNGTPFDFCIEDEDVIESLAGSGTEPRRIYDHTEMQNFTAYHHAVEKENLPVRLQYDECIVFASVRTPSLLAKD
jgi:erythromycin esterase-like protein